MNLKKIKEEKMKKIILILISTLSINAQASELSTANLLMQKDLAENLPDQYSKYTLETETLKISVFKINQSEPALNPYYFNVYYQCKSNLEYHKLVRKFKNIKTEAPRSYCGHEEFLVGAIDSKGDDTFLILPMKEGNEGACPNKPTHIEIYPTVEMEKRCTVKKAPKADTIIKSVDKDAI